MTDPDAELVEQLRHAARFRLENPDLALEWRAADRIEALARLSVTTPDTTVLEATRDRVVKQIDMALQIIGENDEPGSEQISLTPHGWKYIIAALNGARAALALGEKRP